MRTAVIINPASGRTAHRRSTGTDRLQVARRITAIYAPDATVVLTTGPGHAAALARSFVADEITRVVAWVGDGTINEVAGPLIGTGVPLGIVPGGSGEDCHATSFQAVFLGIQPAVIALIVRACHRIGGHCLTSAALWAIAGFVATGELLGVSFYVTLSLAGVGYVVAARRHHILSAVVALIFAAAVWQLSPVIAGREPVLPERHAVADVGTRQIGQAETTTLFVSGLRAGLLTFGGAYTAIPFLREDAVERGAWMSDRDFVDGVALSGILPAPLIIFSTFVGYFGGGPLGALAMTFGIFLPAFSFSILFFRYLEAVIHRPMLHHFLEGVAAGVVAVITVTTVRLAVIAIPNPPAALIFLGALAVTYRWRNKLVVPAIMAAAGVIGWLSFH